MSSMRNQLDAELEEIRSTIKQLEERRREIYKASLASAPEDKVCNDFLAKDLAELPLGRRIEYPVEIKGISWREDLPPFFDSAPKGWVSVRPCGEKYGKKTYLGVHLGTVALSCSCSLDPNGILHLGPSMHNPLIWLCEVGDVVLGRGSWWGALESPEELEQITDADIKNVWYVRALKDLATPPAS